MLSKTHISGQKPCGRQLNAKVCSSESATLVILLSCYDHYVQQRYLANGLSTHRHFSTKLMLITARSSMTAYERPHSFKFTLVNKSHSQHSVVAVRCEGHHFLILYACVHVSLVSRPNTTIIGLGTRLVHKQNHELTTRTAGTVSSRSSGQGL